MGKMQEDARIIRNEEVARMTWLMRLHSPWIAARARPGQFGMVRVREGIDPLLRRPLSFHRIHPGKGEIELLYRVAGKGTWWLSRCQPDSLVNITGPLGNGFTMPDNPSAAIALVAGGIGIAPLFELMVRISESRSKIKAEAIHLFYGARNAHELLPAAVFESTDVSVHWSTDDGSFGFSGYVTDLLDEWTARAGFRPSELFACGPLAMQHNVARWALARDIPVQLSLESLMACGIGACLGCALPAVHPGGSSAEHYVHVCKDGPIFSAGSIQWRKIRKQQLPSPIFPCD